MNHPTILSRLSKASGVVNIWQDGSSIICQNIILHQKYWKCTPCCPTCLLNPRVWLSYFSTISSPSFVCLFDCLFCCIFSFCAYCFCLFLRHFCFSHFISFCYFLFHCFLNFGLGYLFCCICRVLRIFLFLPLYIKVLFFIDRYICLFVLFVLLVCFVAFIFVVYCSSMFVQPFYVFYPTASLCVCCLFVG